MLFVDAGAGDLVARFLRRTEGRLVTPFEVDELAS